MRNNLINNTQFALVLRQLSSLTDKGKSFDEACSLIRQHASSAEIKHLETINMLVTSDFQDIKNRDFLGECIKLIKQNSGDTASFLTSFQKRLSNNPFNSTAYWIGIFTSLGYAGFLILFSITCFSIFSIFVFPQINDTLNTPSSSMPYFSKMIFDYSQEIMFCMILLLPFIAVVIFLGLNAQYKMRSLMPLNDFLTCKIFMRKVAQKYNSFLLCSFSQTFLCCGVSADIALLLANEIVYKKNSKQVKSDNLCLAQKLGVLESELSFQEPNTSAAAIKEMVQFADRIPMILKPLLYITIGSLIVAMYQPLFAIGSIGIF